MTVNFGELADKLYAKDNQISQKNAELKVLADEKRDMEAHLLAAMNDSSTTIVRGKKATVSVSENVRAQIQDFDAFSKFVIRQKALHLFERRIAVTAYREMKELMGKAIPGLSDFVQQRLNVRKI